MDESTLIDRRQRIRSRVPFWMFDPSKNYSISQEDLMGDWPQHLLHNIGVYMQNACPEDLGLGVPQRSTNVVYVAWIANQPWRVYVGSTNSFPSRYWQHMSLTSPDSRTPWDVAKRNNRRNVRFLPVIGFNDGETFKEHGVRVEMSLMRFLRDYSGAGYLMFNYKGNGDQWVWFKTDEHYTCLVQVPTDNPEFIPFNQDTAVVDPSALATRVQPVLIDGHYPVGVYSFERTPAVVKELCQRVKDNSDNPEIWKAIPLAVQQAVDNGEESVLIGFKSDNLRQNWYRLLFYRFPPAVALEEARAKRSSESWDDPQKETALFDLVAVFGSTNLTKQGKKPIPGKYGAFDRMVDEVISQDPNHVLFHHTACSLHNHWQKIRMKPEAREALAKFDATKDPNKERNEVLLEAVKATATIGQWGNKPCVRCNWDTVIEYVENQGFDNQTKSVLYGAWNDKFNSNESVKAEVMEFIRQREANGERLAKEKAAAKAAAFFQPRPAAPPRSPLATISDDANSKRRRID